MNESPDMRVGDTEREQALSALGEHMSAGRLDIDEYGDRSARVTAARTRNDLLALFTDLPDPKPTFGVPQPVAVTAPAPATVSAGQVAAQGDGARRSMAALAAVSWPVAVGIGLITRQWEIMAVPVLLSWAGGALWGKRWNHGPERQLRRELRDERRGRCR